MIITKEDQALNEAMAILENAEYLDESETLIQPDNIPVFEIDRLQTHTVTHNDVSRLCEEYGLEPAEAVAAIAESNGLDYEDLTVAVKEEDLILDESIAAEYDNICVAPISEDSVAYQYCDMLVDAFAESADEDYLFAIIDEADDPEESNKAGAWDTVKGWASSLKSGAARNNPYAAGKRIYGTVITSKRAAAAQDKGLVDTTKMIGANLGKYRKKDMAIVGGSVAAATAAGVLAAKALKASRNKPKSWIAKKIAALRSVYAKWLNRANKETNANKAGAIKKICAKILNVIDALMAKLQNAAG